MKTLFLDESGDHNLAVIDPAYPVFVLGGVIVDDQYAAEDIILRTADLGRNRRGFERLQDQTVRSEFYERLNALIRSLDFKVVACAIKKDAHLSRYGLAAMDPYFFSLEVLVERFCFELSESDDRGAIVAERRNPLLDRELELAWQQLTTRGTRYLRPTAVRERVMGLSLRQKSENISGLQLADLVVSPIGRVVIGKMPKEDYRIVESKFRRRGPRGHIGAGLVVLPTQ